MESNHHSILAGDIVASDCRLVKGKDSRLYVIWNIAKTDAPTQNAEPMPDPRPTASVIQPPAISNAPELVDGFTDHALNWTTREDGRKSVLIWKLDSRTRIAMWEHGDGLCTINRSVKPRHGRTIKDVPMLERPLMECLQKIASWISVSPYEWKRYDEPTSHLIASHRLRRAAEMKMRNKLFRR